MAEAQATTDGGPAREGGAPAEVPADGPGAATTRDRVLLGLFWLWAALLLVATLAQLFGWEGVLDALDVKRWFAR